MSGLRVQSGAFHPVGMVFAEMVDDEKCQSCLWKIIPDILSLGFIAFVCLVESSPLQIDCGSSSS